MKKSIFVAALMFAMSMVTFGAEPSEIRESVWSRYLSPAEKSALSAMVPVDMEDGNSARDGEANLEQELAKARTGFAAMAKEYARFAPAVTVTPYDKGGIKGCWLEPGSANQQKVILYLHGGAYIVGSDETPRSITAFLAAEAGVRCFSLDYPLAPEHPFPAAVDNALGAYRMLLEQDIDASNIVISGDSAGGGLSLALLLGIREAGLPMPAGTYLLSPWTDLTQSGESHNTKGNVDVSISHDFLATSAAAYAGDHDLRNPLISPIFADLRGFPPLLVHVGSHERLLSDSITLIQNAGEADVPATLTIWPGYPHVFQFYNRDLEGGRKALKDAARFINGVMTSTGLR